MKNYLTLLICLLSGSIFANTTFKKTPSESELAFIQAIFNEMNESDQRYRATIAVGTFDTKILKEIDSVYDNMGTTAGFKYERALNLKLLADVEDSLWKLQDLIDFKNHQLLRGIIDRYGWINKEMVPENNHMQLILLLHPPKYWNTEIYLNDYSALLLKEVNANRMPAKTYAVFYDNINVKILKRPQLYGTNEVYDSKTKTILPPGILNLEITNKARQAIGLPALKEGEYRIIKS